MATQGQSVHSQIATYARSAFAIGYAKHTDVVTDEAKELCLSAIRYAIENADNDFVMSIVEAMGDKAGELCTQQ
jgi:hypothetical protein